MYCNGCGANVDDKLKKCPYCKQKLDIEKKKVENKSKWNWAKILILCFSLIPIVGYIGAIYYRQKDKTISKIYVGIATVGLVINICMLIFFR